MKIRAFAVLCAVALVLDTALAPEIEILGARPDFLVLALVYGGLGLGVSVPVIAGFLMGLMTDSELPEYLGLNALALSVTAFAAASLLDRLVKSHILVQCSVIFGAILLRDTIFYTVYYRGSVDIFGLLLLRYSLIGAGYTVAIGLIIHFIARLATWRAITGAPRR